MSPKNVPGEPSDADGEPTMPPDVDTDRNAPVEEPDKDPARQEPPQPPLEITEIEQIEDDAPGG